jgi:hypothetical protein
MLWIIIGAANRSAIRIEKECRNKISDRSFGFGPSVRFYFLIKGKAKNEKPAGKELQK